MKFLLLAAALLALASAAPHLKKPYRDLSKVRDARELHPHWSPKARLPAPKSSGKIVGGTETAEGQYPHQVALFIGPLGGSFCGGSILSPNKILTAAHCCDGQSTIEVVAGAHNIRMNEPTQQSVVTTDLTVHEEWASFLIMNDVCILTLPIALPLSDRIATVNLPTVDIAVDVTLTASGWGRPSDSTGSISDVLRHVDINTIENSVAGDYYGDAFVTADSLCCDTTGGVGTCNGDSGGPLTRLEADGSYTIFGATSFGASAGCEAGFPACFARVHYFLDWIQQNM